MKLIGKKIRIEIADESRLSRIASWDYPVGVWCAIVALAFILSLVVAALIVMVTPLRTLLPGYMKEAERVTTIDNLMRLDSLQNAYELNQAYMANLLNVFDTERNRSDSVMLVVNSNPLTTDSLLPTSEAEKKFVNRMEEREKYNLSVLAPLAAEGLIFGEVSRGGTVLSSSRKSTTAKIAVPAGGSVHAITEGRIIDVGYLPAQNAYTVVIQHPRGFVSRYSGLTGVLVQVGDGIDSGDVIAVPRNNTGKDSNVIALQMWRNGDALVPAEYIGLTTYGSERTPVVDEDVGRGRD